MGIPGIYKELGPGQRSALSKLAIKHLEDHGRPLRLAIDIAIWQFQIKVTPGGQNPAIRTLYYRLLKLLSLSIQPIFVFDGPYRPSFKRGVKRAPFTASVDNFLTKHMLKLFGFPFHDAPGEAEAECALMQKEGIVDAVMSEDVDTMMFGSTLCFRNWSSEGARASKSPTHVDVYRAAHTKSVSRMDSEGMILVALMSGGDYIQAGIPNCGIKTACLAARAGFGQQLCGIPKNDESALQAWRQRLEHEIRTNESQHFQRRKKDFRIPDTFPDKVVFNYYTHPTVSSIDKLNRLRTSIAWESEIDVPGLRKFVEEAFGWTYRIGAVHFIRGLAPALLVRKLVRRGLDFNTNRETLNTKELAECCLVKSVGGRRSHWTTDGEPELRIAFVANDVTHLDLDAEEDVDVAVGDDPDEMVNAEGSDGEERHRSRSPRKRQITYDPTAVEKLWLLESFVELGAPLLVETWEEDMRNPKKFAARKARDKTKLEAATQSAKQSRIEQFAVPLKPTQRPAGSGKEREPTKLQNPRALTAVQQASPLKDKEAPNLYKSVTINARTSGTAKSEGQAQSQEEIPQRLTSLEVAFDKAVRTRLQELRLRSPRSPHTNTQKSQDFVTARSKSRSAKHHRSPSPPITIDANPQTPTKQSTSGPSPRKKRSPLSTTTHLLSNCHIVSPETTPKGSRKQSTLDAFIATPRSEKKINRVIDFTTPVQISMMVEKQTLSISGHELEDDDDLPPPSVLFWSPILKSTSEAEPKMGEGVKSSPSKKSKKLLMIRESLEGAWKYIDEEECQVPGRRPKQVYADVKVVDLTAK